MHRIAERRLAGVGELGVDEDGAHALQEARLLKRQCAQQGVQDAFLRKRTGVLRR